ncbi:MAG: serine hydrolase [Rhodothermales bacterium]|nr:serine hydrolase [Rhodothermales bacterium]MDG2017156.1 serine hydrolase [Rhodothermales bacterium]HAY37444.1 hypothetical protein [Bacteroidota bacterium]
MIRRFKAYLFLWVLVGVVLTPSAGAQTSSLEDVRREAEITGWSIVAIENGEVSDSYSGGTRSSETNPPVTEATVFDAESLTKPITAYIALKLAGEGVLDLDKPLAEYAAYPDAASDSRYLKITARMVLNHTAGFPNWRNGAETLPVLFEPGQLFSYSGEGYVFLQHTLERITLKTLEDLGKIHVFEPFEMTSTSFVWQTAFQSKIAVGHTDMAIALDKFTSTEANGAFGIHTTASDYARFMLAVQRGEGLTPTVFKEMSIAQADAGDGVFWGLGWGLQPTLSGMALWHWGDNPGYKSFAYITPDASRGFVLFSNSANGMLALHEVFERLVGGPQTAVKWLNYERYDDPQYQLGRRMHYALLSAGMDRAREVYLSSRDDLPKEAYTEDALNSLGYRLMRQGIFESAVDVFAFNAELYPSSANVHDSFGEGLFNAGRLQEALGHYRTSMRLDPLNQNGTAMIELIESALAEQN